MRAYLRHVQSLIEMRSFLSILIGKGGIVYFPRKNHRKRPMRFSIVFSDIRRSDLQTTPGTGLCPLGVPVATTLGVVLASLQRKHANGAHLGQAHPGPSLRSSG